MLLELVGGDVRGKLPPVSLGVTRRGEQDTEDPEADENDVYDDHAPEPKPRRGTAVAPFDGA